MKLRREATILKNKAIASLRRAASSFNGLDDDGRSTTVLLHLQHAFEMLLKAALVQRQIAVFDKQLGQAVGFERCLNLAREKLRLTEEDIGVLRAIDALRDDEQHWFNILSEGLLYLHIRAGVTLADQILSKQFGARLADWLPARVLPISTEPPQDIQLLINSEYEQVTTLLKPGRRRRPEARARLRSLLALEAHTTADVRVSERDVDRVERAVRRGKERDEVFPRLSSVGTSVAGQGVTVTVRFVKREGMPVQFVEPGGDAAAVREIDLQKKFHWSAADLATKLRLTAPRATALRRHLGIETDEGCMHDFVFGRLTVRRYSDNAFVKMRDALETVDMTDVWKKHGPRSTRR